MTKGLFRYRFSPLLQALSAGIFALLTACNSLPISSQIKSAEEVMARKTAQTILTALSEVEQKNPYATGQDSTCSISGNKVQVKSGEEAKILEVSLSIKEVKCSSSTPSMFEVEVKTEHKVQVKETLQKDPTVVSLRDFALRVANAIQQIEAAQPIAYFDQRAFDGGCDIYGSKVSVYFGFKQQYVARPDVIKEIECKSTPDGYTVNLKTPAGQTFEHRMHRSPEVAAKKMVKMVLAAMDHVENAPEQPVTCTQDGTTLKVKSAVKEVDVVLLPHVTAVTCSSTPQTLTARVQAGEGVTFQDDFTRGTYEAAAKVVGKNLLKALEEAEDANTISTGMDAACIYESNLITVQSGREVRQVPMDFPVFGIGCTSTDREYQVGVYYIDVDGERSVYMTLTKSPQFLAKTDAKWLLIDLLYGYLPRVEEENPGGPYGACEQQANQVRVFSGDVSYTHSFPATISAVQCTSNATERSVSVTTIYGDTVFYHQPR